MNSMAKKKTKVCVFIVIYECPLRQRENCYTVVVYCLPKLEPNQALLKTVLSWPCKHHLGFSHVKKGFSPEPLWILVMESRWVRLREWTECTLMTRQQWMTYSANPGHRTSYLKVTDTAGTPKPLLLLKPCTFTRITKSLQPRNISVEHQRKKENPSHLSSLFSALLLLLNTNYCHTETYLWSATVSSHTL